MRLTTHTDYALRVLMYLGLRGGELSTIQEIAEQYGISKNHLMKLVNVLGRLGYVETIRGRNGGLRLARRPDDITIGEIIRRMEPDMALVECFRSGGDSQCRIARTCILQDALGEALDRFLETLTATGFRICWSRPGISPDPSPFISSIRQRPKRLAGGRPPSGAASSAAGGGHGKSS